MHQCTCEATLTNSFCILYYLALSYFPLWECVYNSTVSSYDL